jgi:GTP-binding protein
LSLLLSARFHTTVAQTRQLSRENIAELAFVGRSNAGKSSAINALCNRRKLAFASNTPGRTQALNYFAVGREPAIDSFLVDMPGYGYAVASKSAREEWGNLSGRYLATRAQLCAVVLIVDIRRNLGPLDRALLEWVRPEQNLLVLASKADKLNRADQSKAVTELRRLLTEVRPAGLTEVMAFSAPNHIGLETARKIIEQWLIAAEKKNRVTKPSDGSTP